MLADTIKNARVNQQLSQEELADKLHVTRQTISKWERNLSVPDADLLLKISNICDVSINTLLELDENNHTQKIEHELQRIEKKVLKKNKTIKTIKTILFVFLLGVSVFIILQLLLSSVSRVMYDKPKATITQID